MKEYIKKGNTDDIKDILKIKLHMWDVKKGMISTLYERVKEIGESME